MNYWTICLGNFHSICEIISGMLLVSIIFFGFIYIIATKDDRIIIDNVVNKYKKIFIIIFIMSSLGVAFIPSKKDIKYYYTIDKLSEYVSKTDIMFVSR